MPAKNQDLHGSAPDKCESALLLVDVINPLGFPEAGQLLRFVPKMTRSILRLQERARKAGVPVIYVNDNFGRWRSDWRQQVEFCLKKECRGREMVVQLQPLERDYFILKPKHSGFYATTLETLLRYLGTRTLIITGIAGNFCVLFTANDAYMRDYELLVPADCVVSNTAAENQQALQLMKKFLKADIKPSPKIKLKGAATKSRRHS
ncbi:MAG: cysteine hydrolase [Chthoniobacterales bacterium]|nr:cysteine hydrolase [Chthoniobacterales bacterium]